MMVLLLENFHWQIILMIIGSFECVECCMIKHMKIINEICTNSDLHHGV